MSESKGSSSIECIIFNRPPCLGSRERQARDCSAVRTGFLIYRSRSYSPLPLMALWVCELSFCTMYLWVCIRVSSNVLENYSMVLQPVGQMKYLSLCCTLYFSCLLQPSVNICWINEWTNEYVLVTAVTKTNEIWSLPLRSSQSIEHKQQIKYRSCLLASSFFYWETPFHLCLAAIHTNTQMK
jgi:hypothetical protein